MQLMRRQVRWSR